MPPRPLSAVACLALLTTASACGGGSSREGGLSLEASEVTFSALAGDAAPPPKVIDGSITGVDSQVHLYVLYTNQGLAGASVEVTGPTTGQLTLYPRAASELAPGTYRDTVTVRACLDQECRSELPGSPKVVQVRYEVLGLTVSPVRLDLAALEGDPSAPAPLAVSNLTGTAAWTTAVAYHQSQQGWLQVTPESGSSTAPSLSVRGAAMPVGSYSATLTVKAGALTVDLPVTYEVRASLGVSSTMVALGAMAGQAAHPAGGEVAVSSERGATTYTTSVSYGSSGGGAATGWLEVVGGSAPGTLSLTPNTAALMPDLYTARVTLTPTGPGDSVDVEVLYTVTGSQLTLSPASVDMAVDGSTPADAAHLERAVLTGATGSALAWTATTTAPWLEVTPAGASGDPLTLRLVPEQVGLLANGSAVAEVILGTSGPLAHPATSTLPVTLRVALPAGAFSVSPSTVSLQGDAGQASPPAGVALAIAPQGTAAAYTTSVAYGAGAASWLQATGGAAPGSLTLAPTTTALAPGTYTATVRLTPVGLGRPVDVPVSYLLRPSAITLSTQALAFAIDATTPADAAYLTRTIGTGATGSPLAWTASTAASWLTVTPSGSTGDAATLALVPAALAQVPAGDQTAMVTFVASGPSLPPSTATVQVSLRLDLPTVDLVAPYVGYVGEQRDVVVRGAGFSRGGAAPLLVGGEAPTAQVVVSDTEVRLIPPRFDAPGRMAVSVPNLVGVPRQTVDLVVRDPPAHTYASLSMAGLDVQNTFPIYDAERDAVLSARAHSQGSTGGAARTGVTRFSRDSATGAWSTLTVDFAQLYAIALSLDGSVLLVLTTTQLLLVDPVTLATRQSVNLPPFSVIQGSTSQLAVMNDGIVIIQSIQQGYSLATGTFRPLAIGYNLVGVVGSPDGSRAVMGAAVNDGTVPFTWYDASSGTVKTTAVRDYFWPGGLSRTGSRLVSTATLYDASFNVLGTNLPSRAFLMPSGDRAFGPVYSASVPGSLTAFDLTSPGPSFTELPRVSVPDNPGLDTGYVTMAATPDSRTLFLVGPRLFVVLPVP